MTRVFIHSITPRPDIVGCKGWWTWTLPDGSYFIAIGHDDHVDARNQAAKHPEILDVVPTIMSGSMVSSSILSSMSTFFSARKATAPTPEINAHDFINSIFTLTGDVAFNPASSM